MKKKLMIFLFLLIIFFLFQDVVLAQCSICAKTAQQLGEKPAKGLNAGILYLAAAPFIIAGYLFYRWSKNNRAA